MKTYPNKEEAEAAINVLRRGMWQILTSLPNDGYNGDWQHAEDIEFVSQLSKIVHSSRIHSDNVTISDEAYDRLSTITVGQLSNVLNRRTRDITAEPAGKPRKAITEHDRGAITVAISVILRSE